MFWCRFFSYTGWSQAARRGRLNRNRLLPDLVLKQKNPNGKSAIGGNIAGDDLQDHQTLIFTADPPDNEGDPFKPYIMFVFAYGETENCEPDNPNPCIPTPRQLGPLSEVFLQVID